MLLPGLIKATSGRIFPAGMIPLPSYRVRYHKHFAISKIKGFGWGLVQPGVLPIAIGRALRAT